MLATQASHERPLTPLALQRNLEVSALPAAVFSVICEVEKWPGWLSFVKTARRVDAGPLRVGSEIAIRSTLMPGDEEELYEVESFLDGYILSLVGAFSVRRRLDFRVERKSDRSKIVVRLDYPSYGGVIGALVDRMTARRKLDAALSDSLIHFKGLVEYDFTRDTALADF